MCQNFVHLHNHTEYSLLDGANRIPEMVNRAKELGMSALAISDHGVMFGVMEFYLECQKQGVKPILGVEAYVAPGGHKKKTGREENNSYHLLLLAKDIDGYRNLCKLSTIAALEGFYYKPRIDHELLREHSKGLIGTSTCLGSEINQELLKGDYQKAQYLAGMYSEIFGAGNYFIELQDHGLAEQKLVNEGLIKISRELKLPLIATNDAHYLCKSSAAPHDVLLCIQTGNLVADTQRMKFETEEFYLKSPEEMAALFPEHQEALENTAMIADMCNVELGKQRAPMPDPTLPEGHTPISYLRHICEENLEKRVYKCDDAAWDRLNFELSVIEKTGFESYFLLVREFAQYTRDSGIYFGVRGSAAGSLVSYVVGITDVDPLYYDLTFERFLNPERVSMPDIDMDFEDARRDEVIKYVTDRFGSDHVAQIITFGTLGAKASIKDCGRVMGYLPQETDKICKTIPNTPSITIKKALEESVEFRQMVQNEPRVKQLVEMAQSVEGMARHSGMHAAGVVISGEPLVNHIPLYRGTDGQSITAFEMGILEKIGLLKMDFLGLSNLTVLARTVENIKANRGELVDPQNIPMDDQKAYDLLSRGETVGIFQLESPGMTQYITQLKPKNVHELSAMVALYRPGPISNIPQFIDTKFGRAEAVYLHDLMRPILEDTYGIIVFQDQVLKLVQALAGFSLGKADILRRAMSKKDRAAMEPLRIEFMAGTAERDISKETAQAVWDLLLPFADYAFNKAHAVCYAILAYQTAYLKANYPVEYMAALLAVYRDKESRVVSFIEECRRQKISVLQPDVNSSQPDFSIQQGSIRFGLAALKGVGKGFAQDLIKERKKSGPFTHLYEFAERVKPFGLNRTSLDALIRSGALDSIDSNRKKLLNYVEGALVFADQAHKMKMAGQDSLFEGSVAGSAKIDYPELPECEAWSRSDLLANEKEVMGIYVSDHPLRGYERILQSVASHPCSVISELEEGSQVQVAGIITSVRTTVTKSKGERMASLILEDFSGQVNVTAFPATYAKLSEKLIRDQIVKMNGVVTHRERFGNGGEKSVELRLEEISPIDPQLEYQVNPDQFNGRVYLTIHRATEPQMRRLKKLLEQSVGDYEAVIQITPKESHLPIYYPKPIGCEEKFLNEIRACLDQVIIEVESYRSVATASSELEYATAGS